MRRMSPVSDRPKVVSIFPRLRSDKQIEVEVRQICMLTVE